MRLFIAICLTDNIKEALSETAAELRGVARRGRYTRSENLHLTLVFIGESDRIDEILDVMEDAVDEAFAKPIKIALSGAGAFRGRGGDTHWVGVENTTELNTLAKALTDGLRTAGFDIEKRRFLPHVTIAREVVISQGAAIMVRPAAMMADRISLLRSDRVAGRQVYTEIAFSRCDPPLQDPEDLLDP